MMRKHEFFNSKHKIKQTAKFGKVQYISIIQDKEKTETFGLVDKVCPITKLAVAHLYRTFDNYMIVK